MTAAEVINVRSTDVAGFLRLLHGDLPFELRSINCSDKKGSTYTSTASGYFTDVEAAAAAIRTLETLEPPAIYTTLNQIDPRIVARAVNRIKHKAKNTTSDAEIVRRRWVLLDFDPVRPTGVSATDSEMQAALDLAEKVRDTLAREHDYPEPLMGMSGSGAYLLYRVDLPNDEATTDLCKRVLEGLKERFDTPEAIVDGSTYNAARIAKLLGSVARKGDNLAGIPGLEDQPHRRSWWISPEHELSPVRRELLEAIAAKPEVRHEGNGAAHQPARNGRMTPQERCERYIDMMPEAVEGKDGSGRMMAVACKTMEFGLSDSEATAVLERYNQRCDPPTWTPKQIAHKLADARKKVAAEGEIGIMLRQEWKQDPDTGLFREAQAEPAKVDFEIISSAELDAAEFELEYLIEWVIVAAQPLLIFGPKKALKTSFIVLLAICLAFGRRLLDKFQTTRKARVLVMSAESGMPILQETARRICKTMGLRLCDADNLKWSAKVPRFGSPEHLAELERQIVALAIEVVIVDPAYFALDGTDAGNLFKQGEQLLPVSELCQRHGAMLVLAHHSKKNRANPYEPLELDDLAWAGFAEFARQWIGINRRLPYEIGSGEHKLWLQYGGSAGHSGLWGLDVREGTREGGAARFWETDLFNEADARQAVEDVQADAKEQQKQRKLSAEIDTARESIRRALVAAPGHRETLRKIQELSGKRGKAFDEAIGAMARVGELKECEITRTNKQTYEGYELVFRDGKEPQVSGGEDAEF